MSADAHYPYHDNLPPLDVVLRHRSGGRLVAAGARARRSVIAADARDAANPSSPQLEHFLAFAGAAAIAMAGYGWGHGSMRIIGALWMWAGALEYLRHFSPGRHPSIEDFAASALGALCGGLAVALLWRRPFDQPH